MLFVSLTILNTTFPIDEGLHLEHWIHLSRMNKDNNPAGVGSIVAPWTKIPYIEGRRVSDNTRSFVFADITKIGSQFSVPMAPLDKEYSKMVREQLEERLCMGNDRRYCKRNIEILQCITCTAEDGSWYSAASQTSAVFGRVDHTSGNALNKRGDNYHHIKTTTTTTNNAKIHGRSSLKLHFPNYNNGPFPYENLDIAVPIARQDEQLRKFAAQLRPTIQQFRVGLDESKISFRLLVTRFSFDSPSLTDVDQLEELKKNLTEEAGLQRSFKDEVVFVPVDSTNNEFSRAKAINALHRFTHHDDNSALAVTDVDMWLGPKFLRNALTFPFPSSAAYFPIVWSEFNPESIKLVERFFNRPMITAHSGQWRPFGFGMYVIAGSDAARLSMDESFEGWGGEDGDFFARVTKELNVIRLHETGLTHVWHQKRCELGGFVKDKNFRSCIASLSNFEGSQLGMYLMQMKEQNATQLEDIMKAVSEIEADEKKRNGKLTPEQVAELYKEGPKVLVGVVSSRDNFPIRVKAIMETWGDPENIPEGITLRFFVGSPPPGSEFVGNPVNDVINLASMAGITDLSTIVVMDGVTDDEYPPVRKNTAMIAHMNQLVETFENDADTPTTFQWISKVDDDTYVNFDAMLSFLKKRTYENYCVYGERGLGRVEDMLGLEKAGLKKPFCMGGPGYIMSRKTVKQTASHFKDCVRNAENSEYKKYLWHSDTLIGLCIYNNTGAGCWDDRDYDQNRIFRHNYKHEDSFPELEELSRVITTHPFKDEESMVKQHMRHILLASIIEDAATEQPTMDDISALEQQAADWPGPW
ncbi:chondroitin N-acetylgalactosaminyltransferase [Nitzschia inconspicua]|uniref:Chondroitin N-acetylgalactosaminyltransferase n=1 Tax=Nitzschia inconspicua TaxID=303405 RepID=A0A9K3LTP3_9STRA|nr:chondroitin N-acetylgalactosaminyltransferase [Nitzschia inconspicua]